VLAADTYGVWGRGSGYAGDSTGAACSGCSFRLEDPVPAGRLAFLLAQLSWQLFELPC
jgi:hypothetical protein